MKDGFNASFERRQYRVSLTPDEQRELDACRAEKLKALAQLSEKQALMREQDERRALAIILQKTPQPELKPKTMGQTPSQPKPEDRARQQVAGKYASVRATVEAGYQHREEAIVQAAAVRNNTKGDDGRDGGGHARDNDWSDGNTDTQEYRDHIERLTEHENQQPGASADPYPSSWPDTRQAMIEAAKREMSGRSADRGHDAD